MLGTDRQTDRQKSSALKAPPIMQQILTTDILARAQEALSDPYCQSTFMYLYVGNCDAKYLGK